VTSGPDGVHDPSSSSVHFGAGWPPSSALSLWRSSSELLHAATRQSAQEMPRYREAFIGSPTVDWIAN
jgi:hypothetical protein